MSVKYSMISFIRTDLIVINIIFDIFTLILNYKAETIERKLFNKMYKSQDTVANLSNLLDSYLPDQIVVFSKDFSEILYANKRFKDSFDFEFSLCSKFKKLKDVKISDHNTNKLISEKDQNVMSILNNYIIERDENIDVFEQLELSNGVEKPTWQFFDFLKKGQKVFQMAKTTTISILHKNAYAGTTSQSMAELKNIYKKSRTTTTFDSQKHPPLERSNTDDLISAKRGIDFLDSIILSNPKFSNRNINSIREDQKDSFNVKIFTLPWNNDKEQVLAMIFNDTSQQRFDMITKIEEKDNIVATLAHELRTPINSIIGSMEIMSEVYKEGANLSFIQNCKNSGLLMLNFVNSILDFSHSQKLFIIRENINIRELFKDIKNLFLAACNIKSIEINVNIGDDLPGEIISDKIRLRQIIIILLEHCIKNTNTGEINIKVSTNQNRIEISIADAGLCISKRCSSNYNGIDFNITIADFLISFLNSEKGEYLKMDDTINGVVFKFSIPFYRDCDKSSNSEQYITDSVPREYSVHDAPNCSLIFLERGASLPNVGRREGEYPKNSLFGTISLNDGVISDIPHNEHNFTLSKVQDYTNEDDFSDGRTLRDFQVQVPSTLVENKLNNPVLRRRSAPVDPKNGAKIKNLNTGSLDFIDTKNIDKYSTTNKILWCLVVDDNVFNIMVAKKLIETRGYICKTALDGQDAIDTLKESHKNGISFNVILMDCQMPRMDGYEATSIIKKMMSNGELNPCKIIALTANNRDVGHENLYLKAGMDGYLAKPLNVIDLDVVLKSL